MEVFTIRTALLLSVLCTACAPARDGAAFDQDIDVSNRSPESIRLALRAANELSFEVLDDDARLDRRAAESIVANRPFDDIEALDEAPWVGQSALDKLAVFAESYYATALPWEEGSDEALAILEVANTTDAFVLSAAGIGDTAIEHVTEGRPFNSLAGLLDACSIEVDDLQSMLNLSFGPDCELDTVRSSTGLTYESLDVAIDDTPSDGLLTLCAGEFSLSRAVHRGIALQGAGPGTTRVHIEGTGQIRLSNTATNLSFVGGVLIVEDLVDVELREVVLTARNSRINWQRVQFVHSTVHVGELVADELLVQNTSVSVWGPGEITNSVFEDESLLYATPYNQARSTMTIRDTVFQRNLVALRPVGPLSAAHQYFDLYNVDFGLGDTDNDVDVELDDADITWFHEDINALCTASGCTLR